MDIVITYVNGADPVWQAAYEENNKVPPLAKRYRDWGTLKYLLRGIERNMPFVRNVYLVVSGPSQVPCWLDIDAIQVIFHRDIVPEQFLPVFNSTAIEMFLHKIPGLDKEFLYFNDDMYPLLECRESDFFRNGKGVIGFRKIFLDFGLYRKILKSSDNAARKALSMQRSKAFMKPQHICSPLIREECEKLYDTLEEEILSSVTRLRSSRNFSQYTFLDYQYHKGAMVNEKISNRHFSLAVSNAREIHDFIQFPDRKMVCINDVQMSEEKYQICRKELQAAFRERFPKRSRYEKESEGCISSGIPL